MRKWAAPGGKRSDPSKQSIVWDVDPRRTVLVVIDMQNAFVSTEGVLEVPAARKIVSKINGLAAGCRERGIPVIWVGWSLKGDGSDGGLIRYFFHQTGRSRNSPMWVTAGSPGAEFYPELDVRSGDLKVMKKRTSAFVPTSSDLEKVIRGMNRDTVIIAGTTTESCCGVSAKDAMMLDFKVIVIEDATAAATPEVHRAAIEDLRSEWAMVCTTSELLARIREEAAKTRPRVGTA